MAIRFFCDGCDQEIGKGRTCSIGVTAPGEDDDVMKVSEFQLCDRCYGELGRRINPTNWPRAEQSA